MISPMVDEHYLAANNGGVFTSSEVLPLRDIQDILSTYEKHGLGDLKNAELMNRVDSKFILDRKYLPLILNQIKPHYSVLELSGLTTFKYQNCYFDNNDFTYFSDHQSGKLNRFKVRHRNYIDTSTSFFEIKFKNNKGRTIKSRILCDQNPEKALAQAQELLQTNKVPFAQELQQVQNGSYNRISLANETIGERVTIDSDLRFSDVSTGAFRELPNTIIIELKQKKHDRQSPIYKLMRRLCIRPSSFSKYCMGMTLTSAKTLKTNRFKKNLLTLNKFEDLRVVQ